MSQAWLIVSDSGGVQEEAPTLGKPLLILRENTERPVTVAEGTNRIVGQDPARLMAAVRDTLAGNTKAKRVPRLWDGHSAERIIDILLRFNSR